ncbi:TPA: hypothetical protein EYP37_10130 [Candidatus Poribacteria bacterium]|nr:hypothetical protein [Candidatus Poribacteria bacterium]
MDREGIVLIGRMLRPSRSAQILLSCLIVAFPLFKLLSAMRFGVGVGLWPPVEAALTLISSLILGVALSGDLGGLSDKIRALLLWAFGWSIASFLIWSAINPFIDLMTLPSMAKFHLFLLILSLTSGSLGLLIGSLFGEPVYGFGMALIIAAVFMSSVFWANLFLGGTSGHSQLLIDFAVDSNPVILTSALLGGDPMHTKYLYGISEVSFYRFRYPKIHVIAVEYIASFLILCSLAAVRQRTFKDFHLRSPFILLHLFPFR